MTRAERVQRAFQVPVLIAALLVIPVIVIEQTAATGGLRSAAVVLNWVIWLVFAAELVAMLVVVPNRLRWLVRHPLEVAIVVLTPPFMPASLQSARVLRIARVARLLRAGQVAHRMFSLEGIRFASVVALMTALGGGAAFAAVEGRSVSTWDGVWWAISTMTTVGYGDLYPRTDAGRTIAITVMLVGIAFLALVTGAIAERFIRAEVEAELEDAGEDAAAELRQIRERLERLETRLARRS